ncbi:SDR family oxidoreductase [Mucilaginibacter sp. Bleaf8]|uniref:SDR family oxidoreductase n=1 Tax=Mucilaginibacter sp. Bleaf8 TaxID=2834430 RepID=UPI001BCEBCC5|nr:SDR family oxidoreductase [Mucilaginibacter sp. Bleaf8]MBS7565017.1 SDR family oxidoreductase [Mucilaginibacter sp. Bleaf8]
MTSINKISILGCGWYGLPLGEALVAAGYQVKGSTTTKDKLPVINKAGIQPYLIDVTSEAAGYDAAFFDCDVLWISIPPRSRQGESGSYHEKIKRIIQAAVQYQVKQVVFISSTGVYGDVNSEVTEADTPLPDTESGRVLLSVESYLQEQTDFTSTIIRFAGLAGPGREPGRFFAGKKDIPNGQAPVNLIHLHDCIGLSIAIIKQQAFGQTYNASAPHHPGKAHFYTLAAQKAGLAMPQFIDELKQWKTVASIKATQVLNYNYQIDNWDEWLSA